MNIEDNYKRKKKIFLLLATYFIIIFTPKNNGYKYEKDISLNKNYQYNYYDYFGTYRNGKVYIGNKNYIDKIYEYESNNVYVIDSRDDTNPNMYICDSSKIMNKDEMNDILELLLEYEKLYPSDWNRSIESMRNEWDVHNILYNLDLLEGHTEAVDLDNEDEDKFNSKILSRILRN